MRSLRFLPLFSVAAVLVGCSVGSKPPGQISGVVTDVNGDVVRGARVWVGSRSTYSNSSGSYVLERVGEGTILVRAEATQDGVHYSGQNVTQVFSQERSKSLNIALIRDTQRASLHGSVMNRSNQRIVGAKVFAYGNALTSSIAVTDSNGNYTLGGLQAGLDYEITASAIGFDADSSVVNLYVGEDRALNFTLDTGSNPAFGPPSNFSAVIWTSPRETTRSPQSQAAYEAVKREFDPRRPKGTTTRNSAGGNYIEADLYWDPIYSASLLGYGIYRGTSSLGSVAPIDFLRDPNASFFADLDEQLHEGTNYYYEITALTTRYPDLPGSESEPSDRYGVRALGDLEIFGVTGNPPRFHWDAATGATTYIVYVFDTYPGVGVASIWNNAGSRTSSTFLDYTGSALVSGRRYYYVVLGLANGDDSRTISRVGDFVAN